MSRGSTIAHGARGLGTLLATVLALVAATGAHAARVRATPGSATTTAGTATRVASADTLVDAWHHARALADRGRFDAALKVIETAIGHGDDDFGLRWLQAGITGESGHHAEAVKRYEWLSRDVPARAPDLLHDLALERLGAGDAPGACRDLRAWVARNPDDLDARSDLASALAQADSLHAAIVQYDSLLARAPERTADQLGRARVNAWMGRHDAAIADDRAVLARDSANADARLGEAMNENWRGRHRLATRELEAIVREPGADPEAWKALAFAREWDGDPDGAQDALATYLARAPGDDEAQQLARRLARERRASLRVEGGRADDSDGLRVEPLSAELDWPLATATTATLAWQLDDLHDAGGTQDPVRVSAGLSHRWGAAWSAYGRLTHVAWGDTTGTILGGEAGLVSRPTDGVRLEGALSRDPVLTRRSVAAGISLLDWVGALDWTPGESIALHADGHEGDYSDGNHGERLALSARWRAYAWRDAELALLATTEQFHPRIDPGHGYYAPHFHREWGPGADVTFGTHADWNVSLMARTGWQQDAGAETLPYYTVIGRSEAVLGRDWSFELELGRSDSNLENAAGYERSWIQAAITRSF